MDAWLTSTVKLGFTNLEPGIFPSCVGGIKMCSSTNTKRDILISLLVPKLLQTN